MRAAPSMIDNGFEDKDFCAIATADHGRFEIGKRLS
jgi:hypothetical protein